MLKEQVSQQSQSGYGMDGKPSPPSSLPDINAETYPFEVVQHLLDQAAYFNMFSIPEVERSNTAIHRTGQSWRRDRNQGSRGVTPLRRHRTASHS